MTDNFYGIQDTEAKQVPYRLYQVQHPGRTYQEVKAVRARRRRLTLRWAGWALFVLIAFASAVHLVTR